MSPRVCRRNAWHIEANAFVARQKLGDRSRPDPGIGLESATISACSPRAAVDEARKLNIEDYLIDQTGSDWSVILADWHWILPREFTLWLVNRFGDLFIVLDDGTVRMLDVGGATLEQVASDQDHFATIIDEGNNANDWLMIPLVDNCVAAGLHLSAGQIYSYKTPPILGGDYTVDNSEVCDLEVHFSVLGQIHKKIKGLPDGTKVDRVKILE